MNCEKCKNYEPEIKEESLEDEIYNYLESKPSYISPKQLAQIVRHYYLKVFDKAVIRGEKYLDCRGDIRQAIDQA